MGADFVMMGRYFAMTDESPSRRHRLMARFLNHTGVRTRRAQNWKDIQMDLIRELLFEEGVDAYVPYVGGVSPSARLNLYRKSRQQ